MGGDDDVTGDRSVVVLHAAMTATTRSKEKLPRRV
jgi:hypothetical protein